jgi:hypothetical protein
MQTLCVIPGGSANLKVTARNEQKKILTIKNKIGGTNCNNEYDTGRILRPHGNFTYT